MTIRPYRIEDRNRVEQICVESGLKGQLKQYFEDEQLFAKIWLSPFLEGEPYSCWVAEQDDVVVGYLVASIRPGFKIRSLRHLSPYLFQVAMKSVSGQYGPLSRRFVKWLLGRSWREIPKSGETTSNFHFNVAAAARGSRRIGFELMNAYFGELRSKNIGVFQIHIFASAGKRDLQFFRRIGFKLRGLKRCSLFETPTYTAVLERHVPDSEVDFSSIHRQNIPRIELFVFSKNPDEEEQIVNQLRGQLLPPDEVHLIAPEFSLVASHVSEKSESWFVFVPAGVAWEPDLIANVGCEFDRGLAAGCFKIEDSAESTRIGVFATASYAQNFEALRSLLSSVFPEII